MVQIDLSNADAPETYSAVTLGLADYAIGNQKIALSTAPGSCAAVALSLSGPDTWYPVASLDSEGGVVGVTCTCPNGKKGGVRARCWHAAALEKLIEQRDTRD